MKVASWIGYADGNLSWVCDDRPIARVYAVNGLWRTEWFGERGQHRRILSEDFQSAHAACLAAEKHWPPSDQYFAGWLESKNGGYFRKFDRGAVYVRKGNTGWYAVKTDGKLLGKGDSVSWFATAMEACRAVEQEKYTPVDADPFKNHSDEWRWLKHKNTARAA